MSAGGRTTSPDDLLLPEMARTLVVVLGLRAALALIRMIGGVTYRVPKGRTREGVAKYEHLAEQIGMQAADDLVRHFGGECIYVPKCRTAAIEYAHRQIRRSFDAMTSIAGGPSATQVVAALARHHDYSDRHIWSILKRPDRHGPTLHEQFVQASLFD